MKLRALASIALGAAIIVGTTGCNMIAPQATTISYSAAEGINIDDASGPVKVRNVFIVADATGENGNLVGSFINPTSQDQTVTVQVNEGADATTISVKVAAQSSVALGGNGDTGKAPIEISGLNVKPGDTAVTFISSGGETVETKVPVLDDKLDFIKPLAPSN